MIRMMKLMVGVLLLQLFCGCTHYYTTIKQTGPAADLKQYKEINVGWLDLSEERYKDYGYDESSKGIWKQLVYDQNLKNMPLYLKEFIPGKTIHTAKAKRVPPAARGLVVKFTNARYVQHTNSAAQIFIGPMAGSDTLDVTVHFIDGRSGKELNSSTISIKSEAGQGWGSMGFEGRVNNTVYNLAYYIMEQTQ